MGFIGERFLSPSFWGDATLPECGERLQELNALVSTLAGNALNAIPSDVGKSKKELFLSALAVIYAVRSLIQYCGAEVDNNDCWGHIFREHPYIVRLIDYDGELFSGTLRVPADPEFTNAAPGLCLALLDANLVGGFVWAFVSVKVDLAGIDRGKVVVDPEIESLFSAVVWLVLNSRLVYRCWRVANELRHDHPNVADGIRGWADGLSASLLTHASTVREQLARTSPALPVHANAVFNILRHLPQLTRDPHPASFPFKVIDGGVVVDDVSLTVTAIRNEAEAWRPTVRVEPFTDNGPQTAPQQPQKSPKSKRGLVEADRTATVKQNLWRPCPNTTSILLVVAD